MGYTEALQLVFETLVTPQRTVQWTKLLGLHLKNSSICCKREVTAEEIMSFALGSLSKGQVFALIWAEMRNHFSFIAFISMFQGLLSLF